MKSLKENIEDCMTCSGECGNCACPYFPSLIFTAIFFFIALYDLLQKGSAEEKSIGIVILILTSFIVFVAFIITSMLIKGFWRTLKQALNDLKYPH